jgi:hypothetical protein
MTLTPDVLVTVLFVELIAVTLCAGFFMHRWIAYRKLYERLDAEMTNMCERLIELQGEIAQNQADRIVEGLKAVAIKSDG